MNNFLGSERSQAGGTVMLNVGGTIHQVKWATIDKFPNSRLQKLRYATTESKLNKRNKKQYLYNF